MTYLKMTRRLISNLFQLTSLSRRKQSCKVDTILLLQYYFLFNTSALTTPGHSKFTLPFHIIQPFNMSSQLVVIKFKQEARLPKEHHDVYEFKTITDDESFTNVAQRIHGRTLEAEAILRNKSIYNKHCTILGINNNNRFEAHKRQFLEGSTAERLWDRAVNTRYPNAVQRTNGALNVIYKDLIDLIAVQENCGNKIRQYVSHLRWADHKQEGVSMRPSSYIARVEQLWDYADQMNTTGGVVTELEKAKQITGMFPVSFENYARRIVRVDIADDSNGGANPLTPQEIGAHFDEHWDDEANKAGKTKRDRNNNWIHHGQGNGRDRDGRGGDDNNGSGGDRKRSRGNDGKKISRNGNKNNTNRHNHNHNGGNNRKCGLHNETHEWAKCSLNPNNNSQGKFKFRGLEAAESFLKRDDNKSKFPWYLRLINNVRKQKNMSPILESSNYAQSFHQQAQQPGPPQAQGGSWQWTPAPPSQSYYGGIPSVPPPPPGPPPAFPTPQQQPSSYHQHRGPVQLQPPPAAPSGSWQWTPKI